MIRIRDLKTSIQTYLQNQRGHSGRNRLGSGNNVLKENVYFMKGQKGSRGVGVAATRQPLLFKSVEHLKKHQMQSTTSPPLGSLAFIESEDVLVVRCKNQWREVQVRQFHTGFQQTT